MKYKILSILFFLFSLGGVLFLVKQNQDIRNKAAGYSGGWACGGDINNWCSQRGITASLSKCPNDFTGHSCWQNTIWSRDGSSLCLERSYCGTQQLDVYYTDKDPCSVDYVDDDCTPAPTNTPVPTNTPKPTATSTPKPTNTPKPTATSTPKPTNTPKPTATSTPKPTNTPQPTSTPVPPTNTPQPTNTPIPPTNTPVPTQVIAEEPTPTRIILPKSGVEFPSQFLGIIGGIITLLGFLILL